MGGHQSKQSVSVTSQVISRAIQNVTQDCVSVGVGENTISIKGDYNVFSGVSQKLSITVNEDCSTLAAQDSKFGADMASATASALGSESVALTQWLDNSKSSQSTNISQTVSNTFTTNVVKKCISSLTGMNNLFVSGNANVVKNVTQETAIDRVASYILSDGQTAGAATTVADTVNQHALYASENPLNFIADAVEASTRTALRALAIFLIVVACFVAIFIAARTPRRSALPAPAPAPAPLPPWPAASA